MKVYITKLDLMLEIKEVSSHSVQAHILLASFSFSVLSVKGVVLGTERRFFYSSLEMLISAINRSHSHSCRSTCIANGLKLSSLFFILIILYFFYVKYFS